MSDAQIWFIIGGLAFVTFLIRYSFIGFLAGKVLPDWMKEALGFVPVTVLPALTAPAVFVGGSGGLAPAAILIGSAATVLTGVGTRSLFGGFAGGMLAYHLTKALGA